ncbi:MAG: aspartate kinase [Clostridia bacterium]|nr:aspartate kinase [Clostridia bacterium]MDD4686350.1 aspartate kinase [Clostridia bacterium]
MKKIVAKFGGVCMANSVNINKVLKLIKNNKERKIIVVSAPGQQDNQKKITDLLYDCSEQITILGNCDEAFLKIETRFNEIIDFFKLPIFKNELKTIKKEIETNKSKSFIVSRGEFLTAKILAKILKSNFMDASEIIKFKENDELDFKLTYKLINQKLLNLKEAVVIPGFYGQKPNGEILTFTRGGSDYTASLIASGINADIYENWKDVDGVMSCDPKITNTHFKIKKITYSELRQLSYMGSKILHPDTVLPVDKKNIPIIIKSIFEPKKHGTRIDNMCELHIEQTSNFNKSNCYNRNSKYNLEKNKEQIKAITGKKNQTLLTIKKVMEYDEVSYFNKLFKILNDMNFTSVQFYSNVDYVNLILNEAEFNLKRDELFNLLEQLETNEIIVEDSISIITVVGNNIILKNNIIKNICMTLINDDIEIKTLKIDSKGSHIILSVKNENFEKSIKLINRLLFKK